MLRAIVRKELREALRDRGLVVVLAVFVIALSLSSVVCYRAWIEQNARQSSLLDEAREQWLSQTTTSAHQATHDGQTVYRRPSPLSALDPGIDSVQGTQIKLESHQRHEAVGSTGSDALSFFHLSFSTPALMVQALLPVIAVLLSYSVVGREREQETWKLLLTLGVAPRTIVLGKLLAVFALVVALAGPIWFSLLWTAMAAAGDSVAPASDLVGRSVAFAVGNVLYLFAWCATGVALSSRCSTGTALVVLVACWATWTLVVPRVAVDLAYSLHPLPDRTDRDEAREAAVRHGSDGKRSLQEFNRKLERRLLKQYGVEDLNDLPIDIDAARLLAMEEFTDALDDETESELNAIYEQQNDLVDRLQLASPFLAVRSLSMGLAGTDRRHHEAFVASAERYRRLYVKTLNTAEMKGEGPGDTAESARQFWGRVPAFEQTAPVWYEIIQRSKWAIAVLFAWSLAATIVALWPPRKVVA